MPDKTPTERIGITETEIETLKDSDIRQWDEIGNLQKFMRKLVPVWVTVVLMASSFITGSALTFASLIIRMSNK